MGWMSFLFRFPAISPCPPWFTCFSVLYPARKTPLPPGFEHRHGDGVRQVQAALAGEHRQPESLLRRKFGHHFGRQAARLPTEDEYIVGAEGDEIGTRTTTRGDGEEAAADQRRLAVRPVQVAEYPRKFVVIEPGALEGTVFPFEAERLHQMQFASGVGAQADDVAGIGRDFGLEEDNGSQRWFPGAQLLVITLFLGFETIV